jgi:hypothetical protein
MSITLNIITTHPKDTLLFGRSSPENQIKVEEYIKQTSELAGFVSETRTRISDTMIEHNIVFDSIENFQSYLIFDQNHEIKTARSEYNFQNGIVGVRTVTNSDPI